MYGPQQCEQLFSEAYKNVPVTEEDVRRMRGGGWARQPVPLNQATTPGTKGHRADLTSPTSPNEGTPLQSPTYRFNNYNADDGEHHSEDIEKNKHKRHTPAFLKWAGFSKKKGKDPHNYDSNHHVDDDISVITDDFGHSKGSPVKATYPLSLQTSTQSVERNRTISDASSLESSTASASVNASNAYPVATAADQRDRSSSSPVAPRRQSVMKQAANYFTAKKHNTQSDSALKRSPVAPSPSSNLGISLADDEEVLWCYV